jgi:hypothetical protein
LTDKTQWPQVELPFAIGAPLAKGSAGRQRKLRLKGCLEGGQIKKNVEGANEGENGAAPINAKKKKMTREPLTSIRCGEKGYRQASSKCPLNGTTKKGKYNFSPSKILNNLLILLVESRINLEGMLQKLSQENFAHHTSQLVKKYYGIVQEGSLEGKREVNRL